MTLDDISYDYDYALSYDADGVEEEVTRLCDLFDVEATVHHLRGEYEIEWDHEGGARFYYRTFQFEEALVQEYGERP